MTSNRHCALWTGVFLGPFLAGLAQAQDESNVLLQQPPSISVSGSAEIRVVPDEITMHVGVETRDRSLDVAKAEHDRRSAGLVRFLKEAGIEAKDIQTDYVSIQPAYENNGRSDRELYYTVQRNVGVRLRRVADFEKVLTGVLKSGANIVHGVDFRTTELRKHRDKARQLAIRAAREKAEALAIELGVKVGKPQSVAENSQSWWGAMQMSQNVSQSASAGALAADGAGALAVGQISISAEIRVSFLIVQ